VARKFSFCPTSLFATGGNCIYCGRDSLRRARPDLPSESQMNNPRPWNDTSRFPRRTLVLKPTIQTNYSNQPRWLTDCVCPGNRHRIPPKEKIEVTPYDSTGNSRHTPTPSRGIVGHQGLASYRETAVPESITGRRQPPNSSSKRGRGACTTSCAKDSLFTNRCFDVG
jgi:hypothetical protein